MFSLVIPFHSDYQRVITALAKLIDADTKWLIKEILLCHNGPSVEVLDALKPHIGHNVKLLHTPEKGIGAAYRLGIENSSQPYTVLSASDLPFEFTDIKEFLQYNLDHGVYPELAVGSKLHSSSDISAYPKDRKIYSHLFYFARILILGLETPKDSQGTILGSTELMKRLISNVESKDYFFSLELLTIGSAEGIKVVELPIVLQNHDDKSSVAPLGDGSTMLLRLFDLRKKVKGLASS